MKVRRSRLAAGSSPLNAFTLGPDSVRSANGAAAKIAAGSGSPAWRSASTSATASPPPADSPETRIELAGAARQQGRIGHHRIVDRGGIWMLRRQAIVDGVAGAFDRGGKAAGIFQRAPGGADQIAAAVEMQHDIAARRVRCGHPPRLDVAE